VVSDPSWPAVSVIIATFNWSSVLRLAMRSVLAQTFEDFELLVIGDACTDDTEQVVASFGDPRIRWHNRAENFGSQSGPNNTGLEMARGKYVAYLGHDDLWYPTHLANLTRALEESGADLANSLSVLVGTSEKPRYILRGGLAPTGDHQRWLSPPSATMHLRSVAADLGGWRDYRTIDQAPDADFFIRAWMAGKRFVQVPELTVFKFPANWREDSYVQKPSFQQEEYLSRMRDQPDFLYREMSAIAVWYSAGGPDQRQKRPRGLVERARLLFRPPGTIVENMRKQRGLPPASKKRAGIAHLLGRLLGRYDTSIEK
jgi:glycosyltransferase involved in cell wall biosynthesis